MAKSKKSEVKRDIEGEIDNLDSMLDSLIDVLEDKGILTRQEFESKLKSKITP